MELKDPIELHLQRVNAMDRRQFLRPMSSSEKIERAARIYQLTAKQILAQTTLTSLFCFVSLIFFGTFLLPSLFVIIGGDQLLDDLSRVGVAALLTITLAIPLFMYGLSQQFSIAVSATNDYITGDRLPGEAERAPTQLPNPLRFTWVLSVASLETFLPVLLASLCFVLGAFFQSILPDTILPGFLAVIGVMIALLSIIITPILFFRNSLIPVVAILEPGEGRVVRQRGRSLAGIKGNIVSVTESMIHGLIVLAFVGGGLFATMQIAVTLLLGIGPFDNWLGSAVFGDLLRSAIKMLPFYSLIWLITPYWAAFCTVNYYDRRIKMEGFDIRMLAKDVLEVRE